MTETYDTAIIGAGVIGAAVAYELSKRGYKTVNVDMLPEAGYGSTSNSCAIIRVHYSTLDGTAMAYAGYFYWKHWRDYLDTDDEAGIAKFHDIGCLIMKTEGNGHLKNVLAHVEALGIPHEHWDQQRILEALPVYNLQCFSPPKLLHDEGFGEPTGGEVRGGVFFPTAGYISDPKLSAHNLQRAAEARGGRFVFRKRVVEIPIDQGRVKGLVLDDGTRIDAPIVVNVAGPHSHKINALVGADKDMRITTCAVRQEVVHLPSPPEFNFGENGIVVSDNDIGVYCRPETGNNVLAGSEDPECDPRETVDPDDFSRDFTDQWTAQALRMAQRMPSMGIPSKMSGVVDLYDVTDDWIPIYDKSCIDGFYMACGSSGNQYKNAPVAGKLMASLIEYCGSGNDHDRNPLQFPLENVDHIFDAATVSRLRKINPDSSFSVLG
ncbi:MAG: FAD-binding oxidoreductase [Gammaproteobacteria bacterium]|nr:FAD-binding oxidoreductase [Gammaproteobacteria bacterium]